MAWSVPIAGDLFGLNPQIAAGVKPPDVSQAFDAYFAGQDQARKQAIQNLFQDPSILDPTTGKIDWTKASTRLLQTMGPEGLQSAIGAQRWDLLQKEIQRPLPSGIPTAPAQPTPGPVSTLPPDQERPDLPPSIQRTVQATPLNLTSQTITGVQRGPIEGNPLAFTSTPDTFDERFGGDSGALPPNAQPRQYTPPQAPPRIYIPGPGPNEPSTSQSPTGDIGRVPGQNLTSGGMEFSQGNADALMQRAITLYDIADKRDLLEKGLGTSVRAEADKLMDQVRVIRETLGKNVELPPELKAARESNLSPLEYQRRVEANKLDVKRFQEDLDSINNAARNAAVGLQKAALGKQLTQQPDFYSGPLNEYATTFNQFRSIFGANPSAALPNEAFNKVTNDMLQEQIKAMGQSGVGRVLMSEVMVMQRALASLGITPVSNRALMEITQRTYRKALEIAELTQNLPPNSQALNKAVLGYLKKNPMFSDDERRNPALLGSMEPPPQAAQWNKQQVFQWGVQNGLKPGDPFMFNGKLRAIPQPQAQ